MFGTKIFHSTDVDWSGELGEQGVHIQFVGGQWRHEGRDLLQLPLLSGREQNVQSLSNRERQTVLCEPLDDGRALVFLQEDQALEVVQVGGDAVWDCLQ